VTHLEGGWRDRLDPAGSVWSPAAAHCGMLNQTCEMLTGAGDEEEAAEQETKQGLHDQKKDGDENKRIHAFPHRRFEEGWTVSMRQCRPRISIGQSSFQKRSDRE